MATAFAFVDIFFQALSVRQFLEKYFEGQQADGARAGIFVLRHFTDIGEIER